ncbi:unnamed protein product [Brassica rapa]|uniref:Uncharacterized protein n=1 Tax=Brassica campestris TaxID=3711 RepID=A0A3P5ZE64_BRACM|nr:unnamed protein product [Brassica rapa]VDC78292.1 unnamed protein product [Brassica rapa]
MKAYKSTALYAIRSHMKRKIVLPVTKLSGTPLLLVSLKRGREKGLKQTEDAKLRESKYDQSLSTKSLETTQSLGQGARIESLLMQLTGARTKILDSLMEQEETHSVRLLPMDQTPPKSHANQSKQDYLSLEIVLSLPEVHLILESI